MALKEIVTALNTMLEEAALDFANPDPKLAWQVFKDFARLPIDSAGVKAGSLVFEFTHYADRDDELWMGFSRNIHFIGENGEEVISTAVGCDLTHKVPDEFISIDKNFGSSPYGNLQQYFDALESRPEFQKCMQLSGWNWEETRWVWDSDDEDD